MNLPRSITPLDTKAQLPKHCSARASVDVLMACSRRYEHPSGVDSRKDTKPSLGIFVSTTLITLALSGLAPSDIKKAERSGL